MPLSTNQQYPHRIGRVRTSRDFGLSLRLSDTTTTPSSIRNNFPEPATRNARQNEIDQQKGSTRVEEEDEDDNDGEAEEGSECRRGRSLTKEIPAISLGASTAETFLDYLRPQADRIELGLEEQQRRRQVPFQMTPQLHRQLQVNFEGCDLGWYTAWNFWEDPRLWPVWKTTSTSTVAYTPLRAPET